jgi:CHAT domain-containing protein/Flp pilus assembly protein TadD
LILESRDILRRVLGTDHPDYATSLNNLAGLYWLMGDYAKAEPLFLEASEIRKRLLGREHPDYATSVNDLGVLYNTTGHNAKAEPFLLEACAVRKRLLGVEHPDYAISLNNLATLYLSIGNYAKAEPLVLEVRDIQKRLLGAEHPNYATSLTNVAMLYWSVGNYPKAEPLFLEARDIRKRVLGIEHPDYAISLNNLAGLYSRTGDYARAEPLFLEARDIQKRVLGPEHPDYANSLSNLAGLYWAMGDFANAEPLHVEARDIRKRVLGTKHPEYAKSLNNLALVYKSMGDYITAERLYMEARDIWKGSLGTEHPDYSISLNNLARLYESMGEYAKAEPLHLEACDIRKRVLGPEHPDYAQSLNNLAALYVSMGEYAKAEPLHLEARDIRRRVLGTEHRDYADSLINLAELYLSQAKYGKAELLSLEARDIRKRVLGPEHPNHADSLNDLAGLYSAIGEYAKAESAYMEARDIRKHSLGADHPRYAFSLNNLASLYEQVGDNAKAEPLYVEASEVLFRASEKVMPQLSEAQAINWLDMNRPRVYYLLSNWRRNPSQKSVEAYDFVWRTKAMATRLRLNQRLDPDASSEAQQVFAQLRDARLKLARLVSSIPAPKQAAVFRQQLIEANERKEMLEKQLASVNPTSARTLAIRDATIKDLLSVLPDGVAVIDLVKISDWKAVETTIEITRDAKTEKRVVKENQTESHYDAFVVCKRADVAPERSVVWLPLGPAKPIDDAVTAWREQLMASARVTGKARPLVPRSEATGTDTNLVDTPPSQFRKLIWEQVEEHLVGCQTVFVLPDGALTKVPWGAIPGRKENSFLIDEYAIATASYGQQLFGLLSADPVPDGPLLVAGGIDYDHREPPDAQRPSNPSENIQLAATSRRRSPERGYDQKCEFLQGAKAESEQVVNTWTYTRKEHSHQLLSGTDADEANLTVCLPQSRYVHLATHGFFASPEVKSLWQFDIREEGLFGSDRPNGGRRATVSGRNPLLLTGIVVAGANLPPERDVLGLTTGEDGILTAEELAGLNLYNTELITLSACETGLGDVAAGEGVFGLQRALHQAGARSVISSLWKVDDLATQALMTEFYHNLWHKKLGKLESLRQAQLSILRNYDSPSGTIRGLGTQSVPVPVRQAGGERLSPYYWAAFQLSGDWR